MLQDSSVAGSDNAITHAWLLDHRAWCRREARENGQSEPMLSSFINAAICSQPSFTSSVAFVLAHRLADVNEEDEMTTMFTMFQDSLAGVRVSTLADLVAVRTRVGSCIHYIISLNQSGSRQRSTLFVVPIALPP